MYFIKNIYVVFMNVNVSLNPACGCKSSVAGGRLHKVAVCTGIGPVC